MKLHQSQLQAQLFIRKNQNLLANKQITISIRVSWHHLSSTTIVQKRFQSRKYFVLHPITFLLFQVIE